MDTDDTTRAVYRLLVDDEDASGTEHGRPDVAEAVPANAVRIISALTMQKIGDRIADPKTVLAWLLATIAAPAWMTGLLVPVRESGSLLPQASLMPWVRRQPLRHRVWVVGALGQAAAVAVIAVAAALLGGVAGGAVVLVALAGFALSRSLSSISYKDVLGRTIPKGRRGRVAGVAAALSGVVALTLGVVLEAVGADVGAGVLAVMLGAAAACWVVAAVIFSRVEEEPEATPADEQDEGERDPKESGLRDALSLLAEDAPFRRFVMTRALLLVSALSPPFVVALSQGGSAGGEGGADGVAVAGLGGFIVAQGLASMLGGRLWGGAADRSSRRTMMAAAGMASAVVAAFLLLAGVVGPVVWLPLATYFLLALAHEGARLGRSTYVTDMAEGDLRTRYVAASNSAMGLILLAAGAITAGLGVLGAEAALWLLCALGVGGVLLGRTLPEVSAADA